MYFSIEPYHSVLARFEWSLHEPQFFSLLYGMAGCGKSAMLQQLRARFEESGYRIGVFPTCPDSPEELRKLVGEFFGLPSSYNFSRRLQEQLIQDNESCKGVVLMFDDCEFMSDKTLLELCRLTDIQIDADRMMSIIMCGSPALSDRISRTGKLQPVRQRISHSTVLGLLDRPALEEFVTQYFQHIGKAGVQFEPSALAMLYKTTGGKPGEVLVLCKLIADSMAGVSELGLVSKNTVAAALQHPSMIANPANAASSSRDDGINVAAPVLAVLALVAFGLVYQYLRETPGAPAVSEPVAPPIAASSPEPVEAMVTETPQPVAEPVPDVTPDVEAEPAAEAEPEVAAAPAIDPEPEVVTEAEVVIEPEAIVEPEVTPEPEVVEPQIVQESAVIPAPMVATISAAPQEAEPVAVGAETISDWTTAWEARDMDGYFASYHTDFVPRNHPTLDTWRQDRRRSITTKEWIEIEVTDVEVLTASDSYAEMRFWLKYSSPDYSDETLKKLDLIRDGDRWLILGETNLEVR